MNFIPPFKRAVVAALVAALPIGLAATPAAAGAVGVTVYQPVVEKVAGTGVGLRGTVTAAAVGPTQCPVGHGNSADDPDLTSTCIAEHTRLSIRDPFAGVFAPQSGVPGPGADPFLKSATVYDFKCISNTDWRTEFHQIIAKGSLAGYPYSDLRWSGSTSVLGCVITGSGGEGRPPQP